MAQFSPLADDIDLAEQEEEEASDWLAGLPVFIAHGTRDETVPLSAAQRTRDIYRRLGAVVIYGEYSVGHKANPQEMTDLKKWVSRVLRLDR